MTHPKWLVLTWRLDSGSSTPRVATWRILKRMGAVLLTPGAAVVPYTEDLLEQLEWQAQRIADAGGDAWVLPVTELTDREEARIRGRMRAAREQEYDALRTLASEPATRRRLAALEDGYRAIVARDHFASAGRAATRRAIDRAERIAH